MANGDLASHREATWTRTPSKVILRSWLVATVRTWASMRRAADRGRQVTAARVSNAPGAIEMSNQVVIDQNRGDLGRAAPVLSAGSNNRSSIRTSHRPAGCLSPPPAGQFLNPRQWSGAG